MCFTNEIPEKEEVHKPKKVEKEKKYKKSVCPPIQRSAKLVSTKREKRRVTFVQILLLLSYATKLRSLLCWRDTELIVFVRTIFVTCSLPWSR